MTDQKYLALAAFLAILVVGIISIGLILRGARRSRQEELATFLTDFSDGEVNRSLAGVPAVFFENAERNTYADSQPSQGKVMIVDREYPDPEVVRRLVQARRGRLVERVKRTLSRRAEGFITVDGKVYVLSPFSMRQGRPEAEVLAFDSGRRVSVGVLRIIGRTGKVIEASLEMEGRKSFDVFIPQEHPNITLLYQAVKEATPSNREMALLTIGSSYNTSARKG